MLISINILSIPRDFEKIASNLDGMPSLIYMIMPQPLSVRCDQYGLERLSIYYILLIL